MVLTLRNAARKSLDGMGEMGSTGAAGAALGETGVSGVRAASGAPANSASPIIASAKTKPNGHTTPLFNLMPDCGKKDYGRRWRLTS